MKMKLLYQMEGCIFYDIEKGRYFYKSAPGRFIYGLARHFDKITICAPVKRGKSHENTEYGGILRGQKIVVEPLRFWGSMEDFFVRLPMNFFSLLVTGNKVVRDNDIIWLKLPSVSSLIFFVLAKSHHKQVVLQIAGNIRNADSVRESNNYSVRLMAKAICLFLHNATKFMAYFSLNLVHGNELLELYGGKKNKALLFVYSQVRNKDCFYTEDRCLNRKIKLLFVGAVRKSKGIFDLMSAMKGLLGKHYDVYLEIIGSCPKEEELSRLISRMNLTRRVNYRGYVPLGRKLFDIYRSSDIFVLPTYYPEGFPRVIIEAWCFSLPVITCDTGGIGTFAENGKNALFVKPRSSADLQHTLERVINDGKLRQKLILNGYNIGKRYTIEKQLGELMNFLKQNYAFPK